MDTVREQKGARKEQAHTHSVRTLAKLMKREVLDELAPLSAVDSERSARRRCIEGSVRGSMRRALSVPSSMLMSQFGPEMQAAINSKTTSIEDLVAAASVQTVESVSFDALSINPSASYKSLALGMAEMQAPTKVDSPSSTVTMLPSFGMGLNRQKSFCTSILTDAAAAEEAEKSNRCANAIARFARLSGATEHTNEIRSETSTASLDDGSVGTP